MKVAMETAWCRSCHDQGHMEATVFEASQDRDSLGKETVLWGESTRANAELQEAVSKDFSRGQRATFDAPAWEIFLFSDKCKQADEVCFRDKTESVRGGGSTGDLLHRDYWDPVGLRNKTRQQGQFQRTA